MNFVAPFVRHKGRTTLGENASNLYTWTRPAKLAELRELCQQDPTKLGDDGKHKGGRGNVKAGQAKTSRTVYTGWFDEEEKVMDARIASERQKRVRVSSQDVLEWMTAEVGRTLARESALGIEDPRKMDWTPSRGWLRGFLKRFGWVRRRATNKRAHSAET